MIVANFAAALRDTFELEGGYTVDQGGRTMYGVTESVWKDYQAKTGRHKGVDITKITKDMAAEVYKLFFWDKIKGDQIKNQKIAGAIFDYAVNSGPGQAVKDAQRVLGLTVDGGLGPLTLAALNRSGDSFVSAYMARRKAFFESLAKSNPARHASSLKGWLKRLERLNGFLALATQHSASSAGLLLAVGLGAFFFIKARKRKREAQ